MKNLIKIISTTLLAIAITSIFAQDVFRFSLQEAVDYSMENNYDVIYSEKNIEAAKQHHNVMMTPGHSCYFDHYQVKNKEAKAKEPLAIGGNTTVSDVYAYEPTPEELTEEESKYILGAQGNVWTEYMKTTDYVEYMILPRMTALSEVVWSPKELRNWEDFNTRLQYLSNRFDTMQLNYAKHSIEKK